MDRYRQMDPSNAMRSDGHISLLDLIPLEELQQLQDTMAEVQGVAVVVTDPQGNPITLPSNEMEACRLVQRTDTGFTHCLQVSKSIAAQAVRDQQPASRPCDFVGIRKAVIPIHIEHLHLANWWISQICEPSLDETRLRAYAREIRLDEERFLSALRSAPRGSEADFANVANWVQQFIRQLVRLGYRNHRLIQDVDRLRYLEDELEKHRSQMEARVRERTTELIRANKRLQLEVLERDMAEEQITRKSKLLDAINYILQQAFGDTGDRSLARTCLSMARKLTGSPCGFIAERVKGEWQVSALQHQDVPGELSKTLQEPSRSEIVRIWGRIVESGKPVSIPAMDDSQPWHPLPASHPRLRSFLAVPLSKAQEYAGFVALADNPEGYVLVDRTDIEVLSQAFIEALVRKRLETAKDVSEKRLNLALESGNEGLWDHSPLTGHIYYSPRWFTMLGYRSGEYPETLETWQTLTHPDELPILENALDALSSGERGDAQIEIRMLSNSGRWRWFQVRGRTVARKEDGRAERIVGTLIDVSKYKQVETALQKANDELLRLAALDDLTQIANRRRFDDRLAQEWRRARREDKYLGLIICDIDHFKEYNDTYGHLKGDDALYAVAQAIHAALKRPMDLVARIGGEEFAMILPSTDIKGARRVASEVKGALRELKIEHRTSQVDRFITLSFGVASIQPGAGLSSKTLIDMADQAMYRAKALGRDRIVCMPEDEETGDDPSAAEDETVGDG